MNIFKKNKYFFIAIILPAIFWLMFNSITNGHYHRMQSGVVIYHSHPFIHNTNNNLPFENHHHSESEYFILAQISNPLTLLSVILISLGLFLLYYREISFYKDLDLPINNFFFSYNNRAPPIFC